MNLVFRQYFLFPKSNISKFGKNSAKSSSTDTVIYSIEEVVFNETVPFNLLIFCQTIS